MHCQRICRFIRNSVCWKGSIIVFVSDFSISWLDKNNPKRNKFNNILDSFVVIQYINETPRQNDHLLDYIISDNPDELVVNCFISDLIFDYHVLYACYYFPRDRGLRNFWWGWFDRCKTVLIPNKTPHVRQNRHFDYFLTKLWQYMATFCLSEF